MNAALALDGLDTDAADILRELRFEVIDIIEAHKFDIGHDGIKGKTILLLVSGGNRTHRAAVKTVLHSEKLRTNALAVLTRIR
jgi:hypothetical protein